MTGLYQYVLAISLLCSPTTVDVNGCVPLGPMDVLRVYDGDTITVEIDEWYPFRQMAVRLEGYDTPEIRGRCEEEKELAVRARLLLADLIVNADDLKLKNVRRGKYFRIVARLEVDGTDVADTLVGAGLARYYDGGKRAGWCEEVAGGSE